MKNTCHILCLIIIPLALTACGFSQYHEANIDGIDGKWMDENGIISSFYDGTFETRAADTQEKLSEGTYKYINAQNVEIEIHSILRGTISRVNCLISYDKMQLFCTPHAGLPFSLKRRA
ncbi:hypothetical protein [Bartonella sp. CB178]|uniref:hypothetical protein n=1 Tax=Bartonella sp. CB178 TaxID=3112255 RepID=UPI00300E5E50